MAAAASRPPACVYASAVAADAFARSLLQAHGVPPEDAATIAGCLVSADLRGVDTHGLCRLPIYLERVRTGLINPKPELAPKRVTPVAASLDGENGFGFVIGTRAMARGDRDGARVRHRRRVGAALRRISAWPRPTRSRRSKRA